MAATLQSSAIPNVTPLETYTQVADLSQYMPALLEYQDIAPMLMQDKDTEQKLVSYVKSCFELSHSRISKRYDHWLEADRAHDVYVPPDTTEFREKAVITDTRAIADTVLTYMMAALAGRNPMFQLEGLNRQSRKNSLILERVLHQHMRRSAGEAKIAQHLLDCIRYGFAPTKVNWINGQNQNSIINFDPRRTFPDPRTNWGDWDNMQFIGFTDFVTINNLIRTKLYKRLSIDTEIRDQYRNNTITRNGWQAHRFNAEESRGLSIDPTEPHGANTTFQLRSASTVDELWVNFAGFEIGVPQIETLWMLITVLDEKHIIRAQVNPYGQHFPVSIGGLYQDAHKTYSQSLYDITLPLHDIATWLLRSRIDNVQAALNNLIFVDPTQVNVVDLIDRNPWGVVRTLPGAQPGQGYHVASVPDVTKGHWDDIMALSTMKQRTSAASDAQQGMPTPDVRTATEIQRLSQLGSQRLGVLSRIISATSIRPMVRMMVGNLQDAIGFEGSIKIDPYNLPGQLANMVHEDYVDFNSEVDLQGQIDYLVVDGTLPLEPTRNTETWINMLQVMNQTGLNMEYNTGKIAEEGIRSMGITDLDQFRISQEQRQQGLTPSQQMTVMEKMRGASVQPGDRVQNEVQKGNLIPMSEARQQ